MKVTRENLSDGTIGHLASILLTRERFTLTRVDGKERKAKRREVTYQVLERTCSGEKGESKRERGREVKIERGGVVGDGRTIGGEGDSAKGGPSKCLVSYHPVVQGIAYECRAIERSVCDPRRRARTSWRRPRIDYRRVARSTSSESTTATRSTYLCDILICDRPRWTVAGSRCAKQRRIPLNRRPVDAGYPLI